MSAGNAGAGKAGIAAAVVALAAAPFVAYQEGVIPYTYADPIGIPTACAGETGPHIKFGQKYTTAQCMAMLDKRLRAEWAAVEQCIQAPLKVNEAVAVLSASYNVGAATICRSTMAKMINAGAPPEVWCAQLTNAKNRRGEEVGFTYAGGRRWNGLIRRRGEERKICEGKANA